MPKSLQGLLDEVDSIIQGKLEVKTAAPTVKDGVMELADELKGSSPVIEYTMTEKLAYARALMDTALNLDYLAKVAALEHKAAESGVPSEKVASFFEKSASRKFKSVLDLM